jgi:hypothetical protein
MALVTSSWALTAKCVVCDRCLGGEVLSPSAWTKLYPDHADRE